VDSPSNDRTREGLSTVTRGTLFLLIATLLFVAITFGARVLVVRNISPNEWSAFSWSLTLAGFLSAFGTLGLPNAIARSLPFASSDSERRSMVRGTLLLGGGAGVVLAVVLFLTGPSIGARLGQGDIGVALQFLSIAVASAIGANLVASIFQGYEDVTPNALLIQILTPGIFFALLLAGFSQPGGITFHYTLLAYATASVVVLLIMIAYLALRLPRKLPSGPHAPAAMSRLLWFAAPLFVASVLSSLTGNGDTIVLGLFFPTAVGSYSASVTLARLLQVGIGAAGYIFLPVTTRFFRDGDRASIQLTYATVTKWMVLFSLPLFSLFFFLPSQSLYFVYGSHYRSIIAPLQITVVGAFATTLFGPGSATQVALGQNRLVAYNSVAAATLDVGLAFWLVPHYGSVGSAIAWACAASAAAGLPLLELAVISGIHPFRTHSLLPLALTGIPAGALLAVLAVFGLVHPAQAWYILPILALGVAGLFLLVVMVTRSVDEGDRLLLEVIERLLGREIPLLRRVGRVLARVRGPLR
jgi:O-antigen/teichoic acid export membrane protein